MYLVKLKTQQSWTMGGRFTNIRKSLVNMVIPWTNNWL